VGRSVAKIKMMPNLSLQRTSWKCAAEFKVERPLSGIGYGRLGSRMCKNINLARLKSSRITISHAKLFLLAVNVAGFL
jgi:hypothetical protein